MIEREALIDALVIAWIRAAAIPDYSKIVRVAVAATRRLTALEQRRWQHLTPCSKCGAMVLDNSREESCRCRNCNVVMCLTCSRNDFVGAICHSCDMDRRLQSPIPNDENND